MSSTPFTPSDLLELKTHALELRYELVRFRERLDQVKKEGHISGIDDEVVKIIKTRYQISCGLGRVKKYENINEMFEYFFRHIHYDIDTGLTIRKMNGPGVYYSFCPYDWAKPNRLMVAVDRDYKPNANWIDVNDVPGVWWDELAAIEQQFVEKRLVLAQVFDSFEIWYAAKLEEFRAKMDAYNLLKEKEAVDFRQKQLEVARLICEGKI